MKEINNINECVQYKFKNLEKCLDCNGFGELPEGKLCKDYEPKVEYLEDYLNGEEE